VDDEEDVDFGARGVKAWLLLASRSRNDKENDSFMMMVMNKLRGYGRERELRRVFFF
jgi:hypothetical protein